METYQIIIFAGFCLGFYLLVRNRSLKKGKKDLQESCTKALNDLESLRWFLNQISQLSPATIDFKLKELIEEESKGDPMVTNVDRSQQKIVLQRLQAILLERFVLNLPNTSDSIMDYLNYQYFPRFSPIEEIGFSSRSLALHDNIMPRWQKYLNHLTSSDQSKTICDRIASLKNVPFFHCPPSAKENPEQIDDQEWFQILRAHTDILAKVDMNAYSSYTHDLVRALPEQLSDLYKKCKAASDIPANPILSLEMRAELKDQFEGILDDVIEPFRLACHSGDDVEKYAYLLKLKEAIVEDKKGEVV